MTPERERELRSKATLSVAETAEVLGIANSTLNKWEDRGLIDRIPGTYRFSWAEIDTCLAGRKKLSPAERRIRGPYRPTRRARKAEV